MDANEKDTDNLENQDNPDEQESSAEPTNEQDPLEKAQSEIEQLKTQILYKT